MEKAVIDLKVKTSCMCSELGPAPGAVTPVVDGSTLDRIVGFHGHLCPGLAMGIQAATIALREIGPHSQDEEVVAVVETDMCGVDAIQFLTGCTFGKGNLVHNDWGKHAYTFYRRSDGKAIRIVGRPDAWERDPEHGRLFGLVRAGKASAEEKAQFRALHESQSHRVLALAPDRLFAMHDIEGDPPHKARIHASIPCARCHEGVMATRIRDFGAEKLCIPCFDLAESR